MLISFTVYSKMNTSIKFAWYLFEFYTNEAYLHFCLNLKIFSPNLKMGLRTATKSYHCAGSKWLLWKIAKRRDKSGITSSFLSAEFIGWGKLNITGNYFLYHHANRYSCINTKIVIKLYEKNIELNRNIFLFI